MQKMLMCGALAMALLAAPARAEVRVGATLNPAQVRDAEDRPAEIPEFGRKVVLVFYGDPDEASQNDPFADAVKAAQLPREHFKSVGVANMKDAPAKPNWIIRAIIRSKIKKYGQMILTDPDYLLRNAWDLGDCNNKSVILIVGKDRKLHFFRKGALGPAEQQEALAKLRELISKG